MVKQIKKKDTKKYSKTKGFKEKLRFFYNFFKIPLVKSAHVMVLYECATKQCLQTGV